MANGLFKVHTVYEESNSTVYERLADTSEPQQLGSHCW